MEQLLDAILELIGLVLADVLEPRPIMTERRIAHRGFELGVVEPVEFEPEEQQVSGGGGDAVLHVGVEFRARRIDRIAGMDQAGEGRDPAEQIVELLDSAFTASASARPASGPSASAASLPL